MRKHQKYPVRIGLEKYLSEAALKFKNQKTGLICNQASVNQGFRHAADLFFEHSDINLRALFGPQHGIRGDVQDNMVETSHTFDRQTGLPIYSLYSETRKPTEEMLSDIDVLCFDLQDVGCRVYTFIYTMANAMRACAEHGKKFVVLDRPNPIGGVRIEGNILELGHESFVGLFPIPMRHGLTIGELAKLFNSEFGINADLEVISMDGWERQFYLDETDAPWVMPSPNMPTVETAAVFPATVYLEGTQISEGRGTTRPFEIVGAPYIDAELSAKKLNSLRLPGVIFRAVNFLPTFQKHAGEVCGGVFLHVTDRNEFEPVITGLEIIKHFYHDYEQDFKWKETAYEYVYDRNPFDVISSSELTRRQIEANTPMSEIKKSWESGLAEFKLTSEKYLLY